MLTSALAIYNKFFGNISAINVTTLKVDFNKTLTDAQKSAAVFSAKVDTNDVPVVVSKWDGNSALLVRKATGSFAAGTYTVSVAGLADAAVSGTAVVKAQTETSMAITTDYVRMGASANKIAFQINDQYAELMKDSTHSAVAGGSFVVNVYDVTQSKALAAGVPNADQYLVNNDMTITLNLASATVVKTGDVIRVTIAYPAKDLTVVKNITVLDSAVADTFTLGAVNDGKDVVSNDAATVNVAYTVADQYGKAIANYTKANNVLVIVSDTTAVTDATLNNADADGKGTITLAIANNLTEDKAETVKVMIVKNDGTVYYSSPISFTVKAKRVAKTATFKGIPSAMLLSATAPITLADNLTVLDQYGKDIDVSAGLVNTNTTDAGKYSIYAVGEQGVGFVTGENGNSAAALTLTGAVAGTETVTLKFVYNGATSATTDDVVLGQTIVPIKVTTANEIKSLSIEAVRALNINASVSNLKTSTATATLKVTAKDAAGNLVAVNPTQLSFFSGDATKVAVDASGVVTAAAKTYDDKGVNTPVSIMAITSNGVTATVPVTVEDRAITLASVKIVNHADEVAVTAKTAALVAGTDYKFYDKNNDEIDAAKITATVSPALTPSHNALVKFVSADPTIATVNPTTGEVTGVKAGSVTIMAMVYDDNATAGDLTDDKPLPCFTTFTVTVK